MTDCCTFFNRLYINLNWSNVKRKWYLLGYLCYRSLEKVPICVFFYHQLYIYLESIKCKWYLLCYLCYQSLNEVPICILFFYHRLYITLNRSKVKRKCYLLACLCYWFVYIFNHCLHTNSKSVKSKFWYLLGFLCNRLFIFYRFLYIFSH